MIVEQILLIALISLMVALFIWGKWRYDVVSITILALAGVLGVIPVEKLFLGFSHQVVIIVGSMFVLSRGLINSGVIDSLTRKIVFLIKNPILQLSFLTILTAVLSAFINNLGALILIMPIAIYLARKNKISLSMFLIPLAFASHLGGFLTLIGTPRNIIISAFREDAGLDPFSMFEFSYVGVGVVLAGILFLVFMGWRLIPQRKSRQSEIFEVKNYVAELKVPKKSKAVGKYFQDIKEKGEFIEIITLIRGEEKIPRPSKFEIFRPEDILLVESNSETLKEIVERNDLELLGEKATEKDVSSSEDNIQTQEAVVTLNSSVTGKTWKEVPLNLTFGVNLFAIARQGEELRERLEDVRLKPGDLMILHGRKESVEDTMSHLGLLPLAQRELTLGRHTNGLLAISIFTVAVVIATLNWLPISITFLFAALIMIILNLLTLKQAYESVKWPVLILLGSMLSIGLYLADSEVSGLIASGLSFAANWTDPVFLLLAVMVISMLFSDFVNTVVSAVLMAPVAIIAAQTLGVSIDPFLMAVAIGASSGFLTPTAHESNALVMGPGGYKSSDYFKVGLPLEILIIAVSLPLILYFWPLY